MFYLTCNINTCSNSRYIPEDYISTILYIVNCDIYFILMFLLLIVHVMYGCILNFHHLHKVVVYFPTKQ